MAEVDRSGSIRIDDRRWFLTQTLVERARGDNCRGAKIFSSLSANTDRKIDPLQQLCWENQSVKDVSERSVNNVVELYSFNPA